MRVPPEFIGVDPTVLQTWLTACQQALQDLTVGGKPEVISYAQGNGARAVTYTRANISQLEIRIRNLARALSLAGGRHAIAVRF